MQEVSREGDRPSQCTRPMEQSGAGGMRREELICQPSVFSLSMVEAYASELCFPNIPGRCEGSLGHMDSAAQTWPLELWWLLEAGEAGLLGEEGQWSQDEGGAWQIQAEDETSIVNHVSWLPINPLSINLS